MRPRDHDAGRSKYRSARWFVQEETLHEMHADRFHRLELFGALHTLGDHHRAMLVGEADHALDEILLDEVRVNRVDQRDVELDEIRLEVRNGAESGVAAAGVVHREPKSFIAERLEALAELGIILDRRALSDLDDDTLGILDFVLVERGIGEVMWIDVQEEQLVRLEPRR